MSYCILMKIESLEFIRESNPDADGYDEAVLKFVCETPLNEYDTCEMICRYFGDVHFDESDDDFFIRKGGVYEMGGILSVIPPINVPELKTGEFIIPVIPELAGELEGGIYDADTPVDVSKIVKRRFGDLFDKNGNLIICK